jgi:hypothetical protein
MYATTPKRKNAPSFLIKKDTGFWDFLEDDLITLNNNTRVISKIHVLEIEKHNLNNNA